jgi:Flp pilus assembly protein TadD
MSDQPPRDLIKREAVPTPEQISMDEGREDLARRIGLTREHAEAYYRRGLQNYNDGDLENAILDLSEAIYYDRRHAEFYSTRGLFHLENNQEAEAELDLQYAIKLSKKQWLAYFGLGILQFRRGQYEAAIQHFNDAQLLSPRRPEVWFYRAVAYHFTDNNGKAVSDIERAEELFQPSDKRVKEVATWAKEIKKNIPAQPKSAGSAGSSAPPLKRG